MYPISWVLALAGVELGILAGAPGDQPWFSAPAGLCGGLAVIVAYEAGRRAARRDRNG